MLDSHVEAFGVLSHHDEIDVGARPWQAG